MLSYASIQSIVDEQTKQAQRVGRRPERVESVKLHYAKFGKFNIPWLGDYVADGWERTSYKPLFVDKTGKDTRGPALTLEQFVQTVEQLVKAGDNLGLGIVEEGQFQIVIAVYKYNPIATELKRLGLYR